MADVFFHRGEGLDHPEYLIVRERAGLLEFTMRGAPEPVVSADREEAPTLREGPRAVLTMSYRQAALMTQAMLVVPPDASMRDKVPFVCWFDDTIQRDAFVARLKEAVPEMGETSLDTESRE